MTENKRLLLVGGGYADIPLIIEAQKLGYYVISSGNRACDLGHQYADKYVPADFSEPEAVLEVAVSNRINAICPCANDFSAIACSYVAERLGLPGHDAYETSKLIHHKDAYRQFASANALPTPKAKGFSDLNSARLGVRSFGFPVIVKPVDLTGGKGITKVNCLADVEDALAKAFLVSKEKRVIVEEFIEGERHGFSALIKSGKVVFYFLDNEEYYLNPYMVSAASAPACVSDAIAHELVKQAETISHKLSLTDGIFHVQYILAEQQPIIIEICRRPPGDLYIKLVEYATGVNYPMWLVKLFSGEDCSDIVHQNVKGYFLRHCVMADRNGIVFDVEIAPEVQSNIIDRMMWWKPGDVVNNYLTQKLGIVFLKFGSMDEMLNRTANMHRFIRPVFSRVDATYVSE